MRRNSSRDLEDVFPNMGTEGYSITSPEDPNYNCIGWALGDNEQWWWPVENISGTYWPEGIPYQETVSVVAQIFLLRGYEEVALEDPSAEVVIYAHADGVPTHVARKNSAGVWASKLGLSEDIEHATTRALEGALYGQVVSAFVRKHS